MRLFKRKSTGTWYVEYERNKRLSLRTKNKQEAIKRFKEFQRLYFQKKFGDKSRKIELYNFMDEYLEWLSESRSYGTYKKFLTISKKFTEFCGNIYLDSVDERLIDKYIIYLKKQKLSTYTINGHIRHLKAAFNKAVHWKYIEKNP